ncbi:hypothetical protein HRbin40_01325 [bacterium HR40]|nr:hypothetical protein HRbin40_01325 [bacterium HR40]
MSRMVLTALGYGFLALGVVGLFLPFLQGVLFIVVGLVLLSRHAPWAQRLLERFKARHPGARAVVERAERLVRLLIYRMRVTTRRLLRWLRMRA